MIAIDAVADAGNDEAGQRDAHLPLRDRPDDDRHEKDAQDRQKVRNIHDERVDHASGAPTLEAPPALAKAAKRQGGLRSGRL
ncbi:MAG: hypothetical protein QM722_00980 [Piscinibacter sp.]